MVLLIRRQTNNRTVVGDHIALFFDQLGIDRAHDEAASQLGTSQLAQHLVYTFEGQCLGGGAKRLIRRPLSNVLKGHPGKLAAQFDEPFAVFFLERFADRGFRPPGYSDIRPSGLRGLALGNDDHKGTRSPSTFAPTILAPIRVWIA